MKLIDLFESDLPTTSDGLSDDEIINTIVSYKDLMNVESGHRIQYRTFMKTLGEPSPEVFDKFNDSWNIVTLVDYFKLNKAQVQKMLTNEALLGAPHLYTEFLDKYIPTNQLLRNKWLRYAETIWQDNKNR